MWSSTRIKAIKKTVAMTAAAMCLAAATGYSLAQEGSASLVMEGQEAYLDVRFSVPEYDVGNNGAIYLALVDASGTRYFVTAEGVGEGRMPLYTGVLNDEWRRTIDLRPALSQSVPRGTNYSTLDESHVCKALLGQAGGAVGTVVLEAGYQSAPANKVAGDDGIADIAGAYDRIVETARRMGREDIVARYQNKGAAFNSARAQRGEAVRAQGGNVAAMNGPLDMVHITSFNCN